MTVLLGLSLKENHTHTYKYAMVLFVFTVQTRVSYGNNFDPRFHSKGTAGFVVLSTEAIFMDCHLK